MGGGYLETYYVKTFSNLNVYNRALQLYVDINKEKGMRDVEFYKLKKAVGKIASMIAKANGDCLYANYVEFDLKEAIKYANNAERLLDKLNFSNKDTYKKEIDEIRRMIYGIKKRGGVNSATSYRCK